MSNLGQILRSKREERGITIKDVEKVLSIRAKYLEALEAGDYEVIPGEVYVKGFLRNYANYLGLNVEEIVQLYKGEKQSEANTETNMMEERSRVSKAKSAKGPGLALSIGLAVLLFIAGISYFLYPQLIQKKNPDTVQVPPINTAPAPQAPSVQTVPPSNITNQTPQNVKLSVKATADCWMRVLADGTETFEGILKNGDIKTWQAKNKIEIILGNAGGAEITYNDQPQAILGGSGEVVRKVYTLQ